MAATTATGRSQLAFFSSTPHPSFQKIRHEFLPHSPPGSREGRKRHITGGSSEGEEGATVIIGLY